MYSRDVLGEELTFAASGWLYEETFVLYDHQTESLWFPFVDDNDVIRLIGIGGHYTGVTLPEISSEVAIWSNWLTDHPDTKFMLKD